MNAGDIIELSSDEETEDNTKDVSHFTNWGSIISTVKDNLPAIDSDSEISTLTEDSDSEQVFCRAIPLDSLSPLNQNVSKEASQCEDIEGTTLSDETTSTMKETHLHSNDNLEVKSEVSSSSLLFQRLQCKAKPHSCTDILLQGLELPIYEAEGSEDNIEPGEIDTKIVSWTSYIAEGNDDFSSEQSDHSISDAPNDASPTKQPATPILSLKVLDSFNLDDIGLDNISGSMNSLIQHSSYESHTDDDTSSSLMEKLVGLSSEQSGKENEPPDAPVKTTSSRGVTANFSPLLNRKLSSSSETSTKYAKALPELTWSEPTTIYLDLRSSQDDGGVDPNVLKGSETRAEKQSFSKHHKLLSQHNNATISSDKNGDDDDTDDSENDEDDFEKWKQMRRRFKTGSTTGNSENKIEQKVSTQPVDQFKMASQKSNPSPNSLVKLQDYSAIDLNDKKTKEAMINLAIQKVNNVKNKIKESAHKHVSSNETESEKSLLDSIGSCDVGRDDGAGIYASQRLKKPQLNRGDSNVNASNPVSKPKEFGKTTILFAEEPKKDTSDTMNIYRSKKITDSKTSSSINASIQTDKSYSLSFNAEEYAEDLLCSTTDLKAAAEKVAEEKKLTISSQNEEKSQNRWSPNNPRDSYSIVHNQRKQPPSTSMTSLCIQSTVNTPSIPGDVKTKLHASLQEKYKQSFSTEEAKFFPLLYDREMTFEPELPTIPNTIDTQATGKMVLLTFQMSSVGSIVLKRTTGNHRFVPVDSPPGLSLTYPLLISWLLALVPDNLDKPYDPPREDVFTIDGDVDHELDCGATEYAEDGTPLIPSHLIEVPFNVVSLHQSWQEETQTITTNALVIPNFFYKPDINNRRKKPTKENAFLQVVYQFLQSNRIQEVCPWYTRPESPILHDFHEMPLACSTKPMSTYLTASNDPQLLQKMLNRKPGFTWKVMKSDDLSHKDDSSNVETTVCLLQQEALTYPISLFDLILRLQSSCLDVSSLRLVYVTRRFIQKNILSHSKHANLDDVVPCVAMAIRGKSALKKMQSIIGPRDPVLARMTDHGSLNATYGEQLSKRRGDKDVPTEMNVFHSPRGHDRALQQLVVWFAGRFQPGDGAMPIQSDKNNNFNKLSKSMVKSNGKNKNKSRNNNSPSASFKESDMEQMSCLSPTTVPFLVASPQSRICLVISPRFPPHYLGDVITIVSDQGFTLKGLKRMVLHEKKAAALCIAPRYAVYFSPPQNPDVTINEDYYDIDSWWLRPVTVMLLSRENAVSHQYGLISCIQTELMYRFVNQEEGHLRNVTSHCFHVCPYTDTVSNALGPMYKMPDVELGSGESPRAFFSDPELEQVVVLTLLGKNMITECGCILQTLFHGEFYLGDSHDPSSYPTSQSDVDSEFSDEFRGFEVLGIKYIPFLSAQQAKELTPFEVGTKPWHESLPVIKSSPVLMCALRRVNAYNVLYAVLNFVPTNNNKSTGSPRLEDIDRLMSPTPEITYRQIKTFFCDKELFADNRCRPLLKYLPPPIRVAQYLQSNDVKKRKEEGNGDTPLMPSQNISKPSKKKKNLGKRKENQQSPVQFEESIFNTILSWPRPLSSLLIIKPDAFPRHFVKILKRLHKEDFKVVAARLSVLSQDQAMQIIPPDFDKMPGEQNIFISHMTSGPSLILCVQRNNAVRRLLELAGPSNPRHAKLRSDRDLLSSNGCWRAEFGIDEFSNAIHVSESYVLACQEQKLFFPEGLCCHETIELRMEQVPAPAEDHVMCLDKMKGREIKQISDLDDVDTFGITGMEIQPVCVVLSSPLIRHQNQKKSSSFSTAPYVDVMEQFIIQGYEICAMRMCWFRRHQADFLYDIINVKQTESKRSNMIDNLVKGPNLVMLLQRENGLLLFDSIIGSCLKRHSLAHHLSDYMRTQTIIQTHEAARYLFRRVENPRSVMQIVHKRALEWKACNGTS